MAAEGSKEETKEVTKGESKEASAAFNPPSRTAPPAGGEECAPQGGAATEAEASSTKAAGEAKTAEAADGGDSDNESDTDAPTAGAAPDRKQADLALISSSGAPSATAATIPASEGQAAHADGAEAKKAEAAEADKAEEKNEAESDGEDSVEGTAPVVVVAERFDKDMGLLHKQHRQSKASASGAPPQASAQADPELETSGEGTKQERTPSQDEELARQLQAEFDGEVVADEEVSEDESDEDEDEEEESESEEDESEEEEEAAKPAAGKDHDEDEERKRAEEVVRRLEEDEALARHLQEEADAEMAQAAAQEEEQRAAAMAEQELPPPPPAGKPPAAALAGGAAETVKVKVPPGLGPGSLMHVKTPGGRLMKVTVPKGMGPGSMLVVQVRPNAPDAASGSASASALSPASRASSSGGELDEAELSGASNMLDESIDELHSEEAWLERLQKLATTGAACTKVARTGKPQKRTFWLKKGELHTNGRNVSSVSMADLRGIYRGCCSSEFTKMTPPGGKKKSSLSLFRSGDKKQAAAAPDPEACCVISMPQRSFSLVFASRAARDEFVETAAWYAQKVQNEEEPVGDAKPFLAQA